MSDKYLLRKATPVLGNIGRPVVASSRLTKTFNVPVNASDPSTGYVGRLFVTAAGKKKLDSRGNEPIHYDPIDTFLDRLRAYAAIK